MEECKICKNNSKKHVFRCADCGAIFCDECAIKYKKICPMCYSDVELY